jgi:hypothetical protein
MRSSLPRAGGSVMSKSLFLMRTESSVRLSLLTKDKIYASMSNDFVTLATKGIFFFLTSNSIIVFEVESIIDSIDA